MIDLHVILLAVDTYIYNLTVLEYNTTFSMCVK